jgi:hypothetical protein
MREAAFFVGKEARKLRSVPKATAAFRRANFSLFWLF